MLEKSLESPLDCKEIQPVHPKGNQSWIFIGRTDAKAEAPILWPPDAKNYSLEKTLMLENWRQEEKGMTEDEMVGGHHRLGKHEFEQTPGVGDGQRSVVCCSPWGNKEMNMTEQLNWYYLGDVIGKAHLYTGKHVLNTSMSYAGNTVLNVPHWPPSLFLNTQAVQALTSRATAFVFHMRSPWSLGVILIPPVSKSLSIHPCTSEKPPAR